MQSRKWAGPLSLLLIGIGLGLSIYLFVRGNKLTQGESGSDFCGAVFNQTCDATLSSGYSHMLGLSVAGWGIVYFGTLAALVVAGMSFRELLQRSMTSAALLLNLVGLGLSGYFSFLFVSGTVPLCPLCLATHVTNLLLFGVLILYRGGSPFGFLTDVRNGIAWVLMPGQQATAEHTARLASFIAMAFLALALYEGLALRSRPAATHSAAGLPSTESVAGGPTAEQAAATAIDNILQTYADAQVNEIPVGPSDPRWGSPNAPAQLVVFSDFECPSCKKNAGTLHRIKKLFGPDKLSIVEKNYPLSANCNPTIKVQGHKYACDAAYAAVAAHGQGKFWEFHDFVYGLKGSPTPEILIRIAQKIGLDIPRYTADMASEQAKAKVTDDVNLGIKLKLVQTPTMYLNGRLITNDISAQLPILIDGVITKGAPPAPATTDDQL